mmetsp:Transcript_12660/g.27730  ORF Transcript_12660/g.27730 Transcript_12660/m.27730 type:complete len:193 (-) Transcript_12660:648-1226(-)
MALTEEQKKRIEENRKRALEIRQKKQVEQERAALLGGRYDEGTGGFIANPSNEAGGVQRKERSVFDGGHGSIGDGNRIQTAAKRIENDGGSGVEEDEESLEDFEHEATAYISQTEAQREYCVPLGTLQVCSFIEKDNPHKRGWSKMKLYSRSEIRRRARKRFGGKEGLIREREKRKEKRLAKDLDGVKDAFR